MNPSSNAQPKIAEMYPGIYQPASRAEVDGGPDLPMQPLNTLLGFDLETYQVPLDHLLPSKKIMDGTMSTRKYKQVVSSIHEIGLIEPLSVIQPDPKKSEFLLLDGHLRVLALKELGMETAPCLMAKDDETFSYNHRINRLSTVQEHYMLRRAIDRGVSRERLARAFNVNLSSINRRINLLEGICPEAIDLLQDKQFTPDVTRILRNMKAARQVEAVELMVASNTITVAHAEALLKATPPEQRADLKPAERDKTSPIEQIVKLEKEMSQVQTQYKDAEQNYGSDLLNLVVAKGYLTKLLANEAVKSYIQRHEPEILEQFELVVNTVSMEEADNRLHGHVLNGLPIHNPADLAEVLNGTSITDVLLALPSVSRQRRNEILNELKPHKVAVRTLPGLSDIATGKVSLSDVRELDIDDLLGREPVKPNGLLLNLNTHHKTVLVTGAGGSIGSELCRQIIKTNPKQLLLVELSEFALYQIHQELQATLAGERVSVNESVEGDTPETLQVDAGPDIEIVPLLASVCDEVRMQEIMDTWKPHTVYHAAAYKHVPLVEHNPAEGLRNNVWGTRVCAKAAARNGVRNFVLISTDKAVRPTNIMGATKRLAEMVLQALAEVNAAVVAQGGRAPTTKTTFSMVRFGNVLGSSGSVVPLFREQIKNGGPITLTHADITRYFMTIPEAAQLVIQAGAMGQGGDVFVLDMGQPVKIMDLARRMVELSGLTVRDELTPNGDIELTVTGLRPGEKLYEELLIGDNPKPTQHPRIMKAHEQYLTWPQLEGKLNALSMAMGVNDVPVIRALLKDLVSGYQPSGEVVDWVHMALEREALANE